MKPVARFIVWTLGSGAYWAISLSLVLLLSWVFGGDCGLEQTDMGLKACGQEKRWAVVVSFVVFAIAYIAGVRAVLRRKRQ
jgi:hypothetical protein